MKLGHYLDVGRMDDLGRQDSPIHRLDARAKLLATALFVGVVMSFGRYEVAALMPLLLYPAILMAFGDLPTGYVLRKVALAAPFALVIGVLNPFLDRQTAVTIGGLTVTGGWLSFTSIMMRFALTVSAALILIACTGIYRLCAGLEQLGLPRELVIQILFLYRYFFVIGAEGGRMVRSVELRSGTRRLALKTYGSLAGNLLVRSLDRAQRVHQAMMARGFDGQVRILHQSTWTWRETLFVAAWSVFFVTARIWNLADGVGMWVTRVVS